MRENCTSGSARGVPGNRHSYRRDAKVIQENHKTIAKTQCRLFSIVFIEPSKAEEINHEPDVDP
jgi:hypothetical protein